MGMLIVLAVGMMLCLAGAAMAVFRSIKNEIYPEKMKQVRQEQKSRRKKRRSGNDKK